VTGIVPQTTSSSSTPSTSSTQTAFVTRIDPVTGAADYSVSLGGSANTWATAIATDSDGNACVTGYTDAPDFPTLPQTQRPTAVNAEVPFVTKLDPAGKISYSTLLSSSWRAQPLAILVDPTGAVIVSGQGAARAG
jgi:hypothetical protein